MGDRVVVGGNLNLNNQIKGNAGLQNNVNGSVDKVVAIYPILEQETVNITPTESVQEYSVTPSEEYGISEVDIHVNAIPDDYVGSAVPRVSGSEITPIELEQTAVASGRYTTGAVKVKAIPSDYVGSDVPRRSSSDLSNSNGLITAPKGYYQNNATLQLNTKSATAITPTESEQIAVATGLYTTGNVKVNGIPSNYVGSGVTRRSSSDLSNSDGLITAPSGYYENNASLQIPVESGKIITPTVNQQIAVEQGKYVGGNILVDPLYLKFGVIRPDAELIQKYTHDSMCVDDDNMTIPAYSTSAQTPLAAANLSPTITLDYTNYLYFALERSLTIPEYSTSTPAKGRNEYSFCTAAYELQDIPANTYHSLVGDKYVTGRSVTAMTYSAYRLLYWSSTTAVAQYTASTYGVHQVLASPSVSSGKWTIKAPSVYMRGSTTYLTSAVWGTITDIRRQFVIEIYRVPKTNLNVEGWGLNQQALSILNDINNNNLVLR